MFLKPGKRPKKPHKYGAKRTSTVNGISFTSKLEARIYEDLLWREKCGEITQINITPSILLKDKCPHCGDGPIRFKVDFSAVLVATGETIYIEAKGVRVSSYIKREKLWRASGPGRLEVWGGTFRRPILKEVIHPQSKESRPERNKTKPRK